MALTDCETDSTPTSNCKRTLFKVSYVLDYFRIEIHSDYQFFYSYGLNSASVYNQDAGNGFQAFFCEMLSPELDDSASYCLFNPISREIRVYAS